MRKEWVSYITSHVRKRKNLYYYLKKCNTSHLKTPQTNNISLQQQIKLKLIQNNFCVIQTFTYYTICNSLTYLPIIVPTIRATPLTRPTRLFICSSVDTSGSVAPPVSDPPVVSVTPAVSVISPPPFVCRYDNLCLGCFSTVTSFSSAV